MCRRSLYVPARAMPLSGIESFCWCRCSRRNRDIIKNNSHDVRVRQLLKRIFHLSMIFFCEYCNTYFRALVPIFFCSFILNQIIYFIHHFLFISFFDKNTVSHIRNHTPWSEGQSYVTQGTPQAIASSSAIGNPSYLDVNTNREQLRYSYIISGLLPLRCI